MAMSKVYPVMMMACAILFVAAVAVIIAFATPYWLVSDEKQNIVRFQRLGLWEICFRSFIDVNYLFDREFRGCRWIFDEEFHFLQRFLSRPFFRGVQALFTIGFVALLLSCLLVLALILCLTSDRDVLILRVLSVITFFAGLCHTIAVITFGSLGDERDWMPDPDNNFLSWSFGLAVVGSILELSAAALFLVEANLTDKRQRVRQQEIFSLDQVQSKA